MPRDEEDDAARPLDAARSTRNDASIVLGILGRLRTMSLPAHSYISYPVELSDRMDSNHLTPTPKVDALPIVLLSEHFFFSGTDDAVASMLRGRLRDRTMPVGPKTSGG